MPFVAALLLAAGLAAFGCEKTRVPSKEYQQARDLWLGLVRDRLDQAPVDPRVQEVLDLLARVQADSLDAEAAARLKAEIQRGRDEARSAQESLDRQLEIARRVARPAQTDLPAATARLDGGVAAQGPDGGGDEKPSVGMAEQEFVSRFGRCFEAGAEVILSGQPGARAWTLQDLSKCRDQFSAFADRAVVVFGGKIESIRARSELTPRRYTVVDGKLVPAEDKSVGRAAAVPVPRPPSRGADQAGSPDTVPAAPNAVPTTTLPITSQP